MIGLERDGLSCVGQTREQLLGSLLRRQQIVVEIGGGAAELELGELLLQVSGEGEAAGLAHAQLRPRDGAGLLALVSRSSFSPSPASSSALASSVHI